MAYENGKYYWFISHSGNGKSLNIYGSSVIAQNQNINVWNKEDVPEQVWLVSVYDGFAHIRSKLNTAYSLDVLRTNYNCIVHTWSDNMEDSKIDFITVNRDVNLYRIKSASTNIVGSRFLTAASNSSGANVTWEIESSDNAARQVWKLVPYGSTPSGTSKVLSMPVNVNQNYSGYSTTVRDSGCALCCGVDVSSFYGSSPNNNVTYFMNSYFGSNGYSWASPNAVMTEGTFSLRNVKAQIDANHPVIIHATGSANRGEHWVVAYGYYNSAATQYDVIVLDPWNNDRSSAVGIRGRLSERMKNACGSGYRCDRVKNTRAK